MIPSKARLAQMLLGWAAIAAGTASLGLRCNPGGGGGSGGSAGNGSDGGAGTAGLGGGSGATGGLSSGGVGGSSGGAGGTVVGGAGQGGAAGTGPGGTAGIGGVGGVPDACLGVTEAVCGDGCRVLLGGEGEECDDGNLLDGDACSSTCTVEDFLTETPEPTDGGPPIASRTQGLGPHPISASSEGLTSVLLNLDTQPPTLAARRFDGAGVRNPLVLPVGIGSTPTLMANPVVADLGDGRVAVAWADFDHDGDELGVALQTLDFQTGSAEPLEFANTTRDFSQRDPDIIRTDSGFVVAWMDEADALTAPDLRFRRFATDGTPLDALDQTLAASDANEADVALVATADGFAAAWRSASAGTESIEVRTIPGDERWSITLGRPGPLEDRPSIALAADGALLVAFSEGTQPVGAQAGDDDVPVVRLARLAIGEAPQVFDVVPLLEPFSSDPLLGQFRPTLTVVSDTAYVGWATERIVADARSEEAWLKRVPLGASGANLSEAEIPLPRYFAHQTDDQRRPALVGYAYPAGGYALFASWDDYSRSISAQQATPDVALEVIPLPMLRKPILGGE
ncbi:MAG: myxococcus cysteine-rich repeat containing protein [Polyangiaceae bacterium]